MSVVRAGLESIARDLTDVDLSCADVKILSKTYEELVELARMCWREARRSGDDVAHQLRRMARQYQQQAAKLDGDKLPDIGDVDEHTKPIV